MSARIRTVKPALFRHHALYKAEVKSGLPLRLSFIGLFTVADREGRFKWRPEEIQPDVLPHDKKINFSTVLDCLEATGFIRKYEVNGEYFGCIPKWGDHQVINIREAASRLPVPPDTVMHMHAHANTCAHVHAQGEGKGREEEGKGREGDCSERSLEAAVVLPEFHSIGEAIRERGVSENIQRSWLAAFPEPAWIVGEVNKALAWETANPSRRKKLFGAFITRWLTKGWDQRRTDPASAPYKGIAAILEAAGGVT